jgi:hypothetical protein
MSGSMDFPRPWRPSLARTKLVLTCLLTLAVAVPSAHAQGESGRSALAGRVADAASGAIPNATVKLTETQTGQTRTLHSDEAGLFSFPSLLVGTYQVEVTAKGFSTERESNILLTVGETAQLNLVLKPGEVTQVVDVNANEDADLTRSTAPDNATTVPSEVVEDLPTRGRNFTDFALLTPGISQENDRFGLVVNGQRSGNSNISIDGVDFNDPLQNGQRGGSEAVYFFPKVAVREFQVVRTGLTAEVGRTNAGFVNVVTKSGTNRFHGEAVYSNRNPWLTWPDALGDPEATNNQNQFGFGFGGPILRDRLFFFAGVEKTEFEVPFFVRINGNCPVAGYYDPTGLSPLCSQANSGSGTVPLPAFATALETNSYGLNNPLASAARLDWQVSPKNTAMLQYMSTFVNNIAFGVSGISTDAVSDNTTFAQQSQAIVLGLTTVLSSNRTNDVRLQWVYDNRQQRPSSCTPQYGIAGLFTGQQCVQNAPEIDISDFLNVGGAATGTYYYRAIREELVDNYSWLFGKHSLRFGVDINLEPETQQREDLPNGLWTIDTFEDYLAALPVAAGGCGLSPAAINAGTVSACHATTGSAGCGAENNTCPFQYQQMLPYNNGAEPQYKGTQREFSGYIEDSFHVIPRVTLNMGFRYEAQLEPQPPANPNISGTGVDPSDVTMWQPRFGVAWDAYGNGKTTVRASAGLYDARTPAYILARDFTDNGAMLATFDSDYNQTLLSQVPIYGAFGSYSAVPSIDYQNILNDVYTNNPAFKNPRSMQVAAAVEQAISKRLVFVISYTQNETWKLQHRLNTNLFQPYIDASTLYPVFPTVNPVTGVACTEGTAPIPCHPNATIAGFHQNFSTGHSTYRGMSAQIKGQPTRNLRILANYTWASSRDDDSNERDASRELALDPLCTACYNRGYSKQDIRDQFNLAGVYHLPMHFIFSTSFIARTALPYSAQTSGSKQGDFNTDGNTANDRPILCSQVPYTVCPLSSTQINAASSKNGGQAEVGTVTGRNTFRQAGFINWDMRMIKSFRLHKSEQELQFSAECLNCSRASNLNLGGNEVSKFTHSQTTFTVNGASTPNTYNPVTGYYYSGNSAGKLIDVFDTFRSGGPRQIQLGARYFF